MERMTDAEGLFEGPASALLAWKTPISDLSNLASRIKSFSGERKETEDEKNENRTLVGHRIKGKLILKKGLKIKSAWGILVLCNTHWL